MTSARIDTDAYHAELYNNHELFEPGTWLAKPDANVLKIGNNLLGLTGIRILDLGAGVGRNAIPLAKLLRERGVSIDCVDVLDTAIAKLTQYSAKYRVADNITPVLGDVSTYSILPEQFDFILAESVLEHCADMRAVITRIQCGTKKDGFNCLSITTDLEEVDILTDKKLSSSVLTNLSSAECELMLREIYCEWSIQKLDFSPYQEIQQQQGASILRTAKFCFLIASRRL